jgi:hypothetical protein
MAEFTKLREEVEKKAMAAKAAGQRHAPRIEMCRLITNYTAAEAKWVTYTETNEQDCGIPLQIVKQLKQVHSNTEQTRVNICADSVAPSMRMHIDDLPRDDGGE